MQKINKILNRFDPRQARFISREFQAYGLYLADQLNDRFHKSWYIKMAKTMPRAVLEEALSFVKGAIKVKNKGKLFMWKVKELRRNMPIPK